MNIEELTHATLAHNTGADDAQDSPADLPKAGITTLQTHYSARVRNAYASEAPAPLKRAREQRLIAYDVALTRFIRSTQQ